MAEEESSYYIQEKCLLSNEELFKISQEDLELKLHRSIGALMFSDKNGNQSAGTGVLISKDIVLTSAHNIFDKKVNTKFVDFKFCLPTNGVADIFYAVEDFRYPTQFETCPHARKLQFDYALVKLKREVKFNVGIPTLANQLIKSRSLTNLKDQFFSEDFLPIQLPCSICHLRKNKTSLLQVYGYPVDYGNNYKMCDKYGKKRLNQYGRSQRNKLVLIDLQEYKVGYAISTRAGQSGCPIILDKKIIGIHNGGGKKEQQFNIGRLVTCDLVENIIKWCKELKGDPFQVSYKNVCLHLQVAINEHRNAKTPVQLFLFDQDIKIFKVKNGPSVIILNLAHNQLEEIDLSDFQCLLELDISLNKLKQIDLRNSQSLYQLNLQSNHLKDINLSFNHHLRSIDLSHNNLSSINITNNLYLTNINLSFNLLETIDLRSNKALNCLLINNNQLGFLDLTNNPNIVHLLLYQNCLQALDLANNKFLQSLNTDENCLKVISIWITSAIPIKCYMDKAFSFSNQKSKDCKVRLMHVEKDLLDCFRVHKAWEQKYSKKVGQNDENKTNCKYLFEYLRKC